MHVCFVKTMCCFRFLFSKKILKTYFVIGNTGNCFRFLEKTGFSKIYKEVGKHLKTVSRFLKNETQNEKYYFLFLFPKKGKRISFLLTNRPKFCFSGGQLTIFVNTRLLNIG